jgi:hypothetical protein
MPIVLCDSNCSSEVLGSPECLTARQFYYLEYLCMQAVIELQRRLPNARVLYVSATGATEASNLGYMQRLGLWGPGTSFVSKHEFIDLLQQQGISELPP